MRVSVELRCNRCERIYRLEDAGVFYIGAEIGSPVLTLKDPCPYCGGVGVTVMRVDIESDGVLADEWPDLIDG